MIGLVGTTRASFRARRSGRRIASAAVIVTGIGWAFAWWMLRGRPLRPEAAIIAVLPIALFAVACVGLAVRTARVWIDGGGVRWGWRGLHVRMETERLDRAELYADGVALVARRGSRWFLAERDWDRFDVLGREVERSGMRVERKPGRAPLRARLQSYGRVLDGMMLATIAGTIIELVLASGV